MEQTKIDKIKAHWYSHPSWNAERPLLKEFLAEPPLMLARAVFAMSGDRLELPYWRFQNDAKMHALYMAGRDVYDPADVAADYASAVLEVSKRIITNEGQFDRVMQISVDKLLNSNLPVVTAEVLARRFGLDGKPRTYAETGAELNFNAGEISRLESDGLKLLRHPSRSGVIGSYLQERRRVFLKYLYESGIMTEDL
ncbi:MAG: hypothetical protein HYT71_02660 [Candidatus Aenigmarchaeota archaeon]|nr:hypothetical protein [Candidatus Aenigmarchaeota archaeon]